MSAIFNLSAINNLYTPVFNKRQITVWKVYTRNPLKPCFVFIPIWVPHDCLHSLDNTGKGISVPRIPGKSLAKGCALSPLWAHAPSLWAQEGMCLSSASAEEMRNKGLSTGAAASGAEVCWFTPAVGTPSGLAKTSLCAQWGNCSSLACGPFHPLCLLSCNHITFTCFLSSMDCVAYINLDNIEKTRFQQIGIILMPEVLVVGLGT